MQKWTITLGPSRIPGMRHLQARTEDQLSSFAILIGKAGNMFRTKAADRKSDIFTAMAEHGATMNVVGKIEYTGDWKGVK